MRVDARTSRSFLHETKRILAAVLLFPGTFVLSHVFLLSVAVVALYLLSFLLLSPRSLRLTRLYVSN
jgi:hypothetical protein